MRSFRRFKVNAKKCLDKNGQLILAITAGVSAITGAVLSFKAGEHAVEINETRQEKIDDATERLQNGDISNDDFKKECKDANVEAAKEYVKYCGPAVMSIGVTLVSVTCGYRISIGKQAAALAALKIAESKKDELEAKTKELLGEKKFDEIKTGILKDHIDEKEIPEGIKAPEYKKKDDGTYDQSSTKLPCFFDWTKHYWPSRRNDIENAILAASKNTIDRGENVLYVQKLIRYLDPDLEWLEITDASETHGWRVEDFVYDPRTEMRRIPYRLTSVMRDGFDHPLLSLVLEPYYCPIE